MGVSKEIFENVIVSGSIELFPSSAPDDMGWLIDTYIEMVDILFNYINLFALVIENDIWKPSLISLPIASI